MAPHIRTPKRGSGEARNVQIVWDRKGGKPKIQHIGVARDDAELALLRLEAEVAMSAGQGELDLGLDDRIDPKRDEGARRTPALGKRHEHLWQSLQAGYDAIGLGEAAGDDVFGTWCSLGSSSLALRRKQLRSVAVLGSRHAHTQQSTVDCLATPTWSFDPAWPQRWPPTPSWGRNRWCSTT